MAGEINQYEWVGGDGGPMIVLQSSVVSQWQGANDFENSLMEGGTVETDYDVICETDGSITHLHRYGRDMLVLNDSEWGARFMPSESGTVIILQRFGAGDDDEAWVQHTMTLAPSETLNLTIEDDALCLLVGASSGDNLVSSSGGSYGVARVSVTPGPMACDIYTGEHGQMAVLRPASATGPGRLL